MEVIKIRFSSKGKCIILKSELQDMYDNGNLQGAEVFGILFNLKKHEFKVIDPQVDDEGFITIFKDFDVRFSEFNNLLNFLKYGTADPIVFHDILSVANKFGGIPKLNEYILNYEEKEFYNPMNPNEDIEQLYTWETLVYEDKLDGFEKTEKISDNPYYKNIMFWARKLKSKD